MILKEDLMIDGLHYVLKFDHYSFSFSLNNPPRAKVRINYRRHPELALFRDDPIYEDLNLKLPALKVLMRLVRELKNLFISIDSLLVF